MATIGERLKAARSRTEYTQEQVAELIDVHHFTYAKWEQDLHPPGKKRYFSELACLFNCSEAWLRDEIGEIGTFVPTPKTDQDRQREVLRRPRMVRRPDGHLVGSPRMPPAPSDPGWACMVSCLRTLLSIEPDATDEKLGKALALFHSMAQRDSSNCGDALLASEILHAMA